MQNETRTTDHDPVIAAARTDAGQEGARLVQLTVVQLWWLIHRAPTLSADERRQLSGIIHAR